MIKNRDSLECSVVVSSCEALKRTVDRFGKSFEVFESDVEYRNACMYNLIVIGQAIRRISNSVKFGIDEVDWDEFVNISDRLSLGSRSVPQITVWSIVIDKIEILCDFCIGLALGYNEPIRKVVI